MIIDRLDVAHPASDAELEREPLIVVARPRARRQKPLDRRRLQAGPGRVRRRRLVIAGARPLEAADLGEELVSIALKIQGLPANLWAA